MLTSFIPYFLIAIVPDKSVWQNGPEFKFDSDVAIKMHGINGTNQVHGFNITNEYICRPKTESSLQCHFRNKKVIVYKTDTDTGETESKDRSAQQDFEPFFFGVGFDKKGVNKIIVEETLSKYEEVLDISKAMAVSLNVAADLSGLKTASDSVELGKVPNLFPGQCKGDVLANLQTSPEEDNSNDAEWSLEVNPPTEKLAGRNLNIMKTWNISDCKTADNFFWLGMFVQLHTEDSPNGANLTVNSLKVHDRMTVSKGSFDYMSAINMKVNVKKSSVPPEERDINIEELSKIRLITVQPATETWPEIKNAVIINL